VTQTDNSSKLGASGKLAALAAQLYTVPTVNDLFNELFQPEALVAVFEERFSRSASKGVDRLNGYQFSQQAIMSLKVAAAKCLNGAYRFSPYLENLKSKGRQKAPRLISIPTVRDRVVLHQINKVLAAAFPESVPRNIANAYVRVIGEDLKALPPDTTFVCGCDIKTFYDSINRDRLLPILDGSLKCSLALGLIRHAINTPTVPKNTRRANYSRFSLDKGVPQGLAISNILAAIYLRDVDVAIGGMDVKYFRYVDDVLMYGTESKVRAAHRSLAARLRHRGLGLHKLGIGKSHIGPLKDSFDYLGYHFSWPIVTVREASVERLLQSLAAKFSDYKHNKSRRLERSKYLTDGRLVEIFVLELNERISGAISDKRRYGWIAYFDQINDLTLLHKLDHAMQGMFQRLADFKKQVPPDLKKFSRAYFEMKFNPMGNYVRNYDRIATRAEKLAFLLERGRVAADEALTDEQISAKFESYRRYVLSQMQADEQLIYG
jgi:retron-type reverse transcriptase